MVSIQGVSLAADQLCAVVGADAGSAPRVWRTALEPRAPGDEAWPSLAAAFAALLNEAPAPAAGVSVALMPALAEVQMVELPPMAEHELRLLLARNAGKYFTSARGAQVVGAGARSTSVMGRLVAATSAPLLHSIHAAASTAGLSVRQVVPAPAAWAMFARTGNAKSNGGEARASMVVVDQAHCTVLTVEQGQLVSLRRFRSLALDAARLAEAMLADTTSVFLAAAPDARREAEALMRVQPATGVLAALGSQPDALAAVGASRATAPLLITERERAAGTARVRSLAVRFAAAAAILLVAGAALQLWDVRRELSAVRAERAALAPQLGSTLVGRTTVETAFRQLAVLARAEQDAPIWSAVIAELSTQLPSESYLTGFRGRADTVGIDGLARSAARVFESVERVPSLQAVQASAPVRRETTPEGEALERFQLSALMRAREARGATTARRQP